MVVRRNKIVSATCDRPPPWQETGMRRQDVTVRVSPNSLATAVPFCVMAVVACFDLVVGTQVGFMSLLSLGPALAPVSLGPVRTMLTGGVAIVPEPPARRRRRHRALDPRVRVVRHDRGRHGGGRDRQRRAPAQGAGTGRRAGGRGRRPARPPAPGAARGRPAPDSRALHLGRRGGADRRRPLRCRRGGGNRPADRRRRAGQGPGGGPDGGGGAGGVPRGGLRRAGSGGDRDAHRAEP